ncbi:MAG TPA: thiamine phosphate synthase [Candidatus Binataceae bacterium]|nr:thiamine phosphate synthase [Candidatus Binataceae bacterium]
MVQDRLKAQFQLYLITDRRLAALRGGLIETVQAALAGGAELGPGRIAVQLREKDLEAGELYKLALALKQVCSRFAAPLIVNDRIDVAMAANADGVHLATTSFSVADARALLGSSRFIGVSTHDAHEVGAAAEAGADFAVFGPIYDPLSKGAYGPAKGLNPLMESVKVAGDMPVYALGGITVSRAAEIAALAPSSRPFGIAAIGAVLGSATPGSASRELLQAFRPPR